MNITELEKAILNQYDNGRYSPVGADGGCLKYIIVDVNGFKYNASITSDYDISKIRRIWELNKLTPSDANSTSPYKYDNIYDFTKEYYSTRGL